ncbi:hypothetical protein A1O1_01869 [Capronia coronata CBS 617.96]|uniref:Uncharacterized protein n=1 Tax=Capronia coronata CBS 617.96 TaxID=1182541 RepID=W9YKQ7_9EURO|nr:uncharacterized protein A1O1_01869 [Capronia coronata CBS 617.96]EXJ93477.1 hypothetical protein A1O1_01869 [Capronia coronata CBS 617.96]
MPPDSPKRHRLRNVKEFLQWHDSGPSDAIEIDSDEDGPPARDDQKTRSRRRLQPEQSHITASEIAVKRSSSRNEASLLPTFLYEPKSDHSDHGAESFISRRTPGTVTIPDPMKKPVLFKSHYKPVDQLSAPRQGTKSQHIFDQTRDIRDHDNRQVHASKKRKLDNNDATGSSATSAITLEDSQNREDSADELRLSPESPKGETTDRGRRHHAPHHVYISVHRPNGVGNSARQPVSQLRGSSSEDEGAFTKGSAKERKAEKDRMLASSPPAPSSTVRAETVSSPYFNATQTPFRAPRHKPLQHESPDELQTGHSPKLQASSVRTRKALGEVDMKTLGALKPGDGHTTANPKPGNPPAKRAVNNIKSFKIVEVVYPTLGDSDIYVIEVHCDTNTISINTDEEMLGNDPVVKDRLISKIVEVKQGSAKSQLVFLTFSRQGQHEDKMHLRLQSPKAAYDFVTLLQECCRSVKVIAKEE